MKRLKKLAEQLTIYHGTDSEHMVKIINSGSINPSDGVEWGPGSHGHAIVKGIYVARDYDIAKNYSAHSGDVEPFFYDDEYNYSILLTIKLDQDKYNFVIDEDHLEYLDNDDNWKSFMLECKKEGLLDKYNLDEDELPYPCDVMDDINIVSKYKFNLNDPSISSFCVMDSIPINNIESMEIFGFNNDSYKTSDISIDSLNKLIQLINENKKE